MPPWKLRTHLHDYHYLPLNMSAGWGQGSTGVTIPPLYFFSLVNQGKAARIAYCGTYMQLVKRFMSA
jgi:hypothetical protein